MSLPANENSDEQQSINEDCLSLPISFSGIIIIHSNRLVLTMGVGTTRSQYAFTALVVTTMLLF